MGPNETPKPENSFPARGRRKANSIAAHIGSIVKEVTEKSEWQGGHKQWADQGQTAFYSRV